MAASDFYAACTACTPFRLCGACDQRTHNEGFLREDGRTINPAVLQHKIRSWSVDLVLYRRLTHDLGQTEMAEAIGVAVEALLNIDMKTWSA